MPQPETAEELIGSQLSVTAVSLEQGFYLIAYLIASEAWIDWMRFAFRSCGESEKFRPPQRPIRSQISPTKVSWRGAMVIGGW